MGCTNFIKALIKDQSEIEAGRVISISILHVHATVAGPVAMAYLNMASLEFQSTHAYSSPAFVTSPDAQVLQCLLQTFSSLQVPKVVTKGLKYDLLTRCGQG